MLLNFNRTNTLEKNTSPNYIGQENICLLNIDGNQSDLRISEILYPDNADRPLEIHIAKTIKQAVSGIGRRFILKLKNVRSLSPDASGRSLSECSERSLSEPDVSGERSIC